MQGMRGRWCRLVRAARLSELFALRGERYWSAQESGAPSSTIQIMMANHTTRHRLYQRHQQESRKGQGQVMKTWKHFLRGFVVGFTTPWRVARTWQLELAAVAEADQVRAILGASPGETLKQAAERIKVACSERASERDAARGVVERMSPMVKTAEQWRDHLYRGKHATSDGVRICDAPIIRAVDAYRSEPGPSQDQLATMIEAAVDAVAKGELRTLKRDEIKPWLDGVSAGAAMNDAAERLVFALHIYPNYRVDSRGPAGCIMRALEAIAPDVAAELLARDANEVYDRYWTEDGASC